MGQLDQDLRAAVDSSDRISQLATDLAEKPGLYQHLTYRLGLPVNHLVDEVFADAPLIQCELSDKVRWPRRTGHPDGRQPQHMPPGRAAWCCRPGQGVLDGHRRGLALFEVAEELAEQLAIRHADCLWRFADTPENLRSRVPQITAHGTEVGLLVSILARPTQEAAVRDAYAMIQSLSAKQAQPFGKEFAQKTDSVAYRSTLELAERSKSDWLTPWLWTGAIPYLGSPAIALVGGPEEIAAAIMEYKEIGISQFLFMGWPDLDEMTFFGREILPLVREKEQEAAGLLQVHQ